VASSACRQLLQNKHANEPSGGTLLSSERPLEQLWTRPAALRRQVQLGATTGPVGRFSQRQRDARRICAQVLGMRNILPANPPG